MNFISIAEYLEINIKEYCSEKNNLILLACMSFIHESCTLAEMRQKQQIKNENPSTLFPTSYKNKFAKIKTNIDIDLKACKFISS